MCGSSGGSAEQAERERQAKIDQSIQAINQAFGDAGDKPAFSGVAPVQPSASIFSAPQNTGPLGVFDDESGTSHNEFTQQQNQLRVANSYEGKRSAYENALADHNTSLANWESAQEAGGLRQQTYGDHRENIFDFNMDRLDTQKTDADRELSFSLARRGLAGGTADIDASRRLADNYDLGALAVASHADGASNELKSSDEQAKLRLISMAQNGLSAGAATNQALQQIQLSSEQAQSDRSEASLGDLFSGVALMNQQQIAAQQQYTNPYLRRSNTGTQGNNGSVTGVG